MSNYTSTLTPREYATIPAAHAVKIGLKDQDYAALLCTDKAGQRWTRVGTDLNYLKMLILGASFRPRATGVFNIPPATFPQVRAGWPDDWV
ncbi:hypothetical protein [Cryobacterium sp. TMT2-4]|uniref:hypothetical protein n=1 Tax=Cryobacterium sp. TMT2-4 TaxID=1259254 RepID=UPI001069A7BB|nr:hypothetical protein [Cryobacterium sp. TMT2-4]TFC71607.1 hypothetical protein E3O54_00285 [Cryobacterium sp. TMT2-4]